VAAIYSFARIADDFADEARYEGQDRLALLDRWRERLRSCASGSDDHPVFLALGHTLATRHLPLEPFEDLLAAFRMDATTKFYASWNDLLGYCRYSANPVGRLMLLLFGHSGPHLHAPSDAICTALQLTNFWQDVQVDLRKGRCYIPREDLRYFGVADADLAARKATTAFQDLMRFEISRTRVLFAGGTALPSLVGGRFGFQLRVVIASGTRILEKIEEAGCDVFSRRPVLSGADWGRVLLRSAAAGGSRAGGEI